MRLIRPAAGRARSARRHPAHRLHACRHPLSGRLALAALLLGGAALPAAAQSYDGIEHSNLPPPSSSYGAPTAPTPYQTPVQPSPRQAAPQPGGVQPGPTPNGTMAPEGTTAVMPGEGGDVTVVQPPSVKIPNRYAVYTGLDKITGRTTTFDVAIGETAQFGALQVTPRVCYTRPPTETQNTTSFTEVNEVTLKGEAKRIFTGWMFASSPGLHAVEHPIYDVWLIGCKTPLPVTAGPDAGQQ